jgi:hypothetical protein
MALLDDVREILHQLAPHGWRELLLEFGLDITAANLGAELTRFLDRLSPGQRPNIPGFEDFSSAARHGVEPGIPDRSLLYHALASPHVTRKPNGAPLTRFPTPKQIETVENYIYSLQRRTLQELRALARARSGTPAGGPDPELDIVVFSPEYRNATQSVHGKEAGMCFSRTGVARVGTKPPLYSSADRGYLPSIPGDPHSFCVLPARYAAYLAFKSNGKRELFGPTGSPTGGGDRARSFWVPLHKLFDGTECIEGANLKVRLKARHVNEKLKRLYQESAITGIRVSQPAHKKADRKKPPFTIKEGIAEFSTKVDDGTGLLVPVPHATLVEEAKFKGQTLAFRKEAGRDMLSSSYSIPPTNGIRRAPQFVHVRTELPSNGPPKDLNDTDKTESELIESIEDRQYFAVHYIDFTGDGWISVTCQGISRLPLLPAYSLVTAPDFFFACNQLDLSDWTSGPELPARYRHKVWVLPPSPLNDERIAVNLQLNLQPSGPGFNATDDTMTAIVALPLEERGSVAPMKLTEPNRHAWLPDAASSVFDPGWDISFTKNNGVRHLAAYVLGSPFPEDAKLCAALSSFWPGVTPDVSRTFSPKSADKKDWPTVLPLTDEEIGLGGGISLDGYSGPRFIEADQEVEYESFAHVDYVRSALNNRFSLVLTSQIDFEEYRDRVLAMMRVYRAVGVNLTLSDDDLRAAKAVWAVLSFRVGNTSDPELQVALNGTSINTAGRIYRFVLYKHGKQRFVKNKARIAVQPNTLTTLYVLKSAIRMKQAPNSTWVTRLEN